MAMGERLEVETAASPIVALDMSLLAHHMVAALARVPFRKPTSGELTPWSNIATSVTREVIKSLIGYSASLPLPEFRSVELVLDTFCRRAFSPLVRSFDVTSHELRLGGVPGILYLPRGVPPAGVILYLHGGGYVGSSPSMYSFFTARLCEITECAVFVADYRLAPEFPYPAGVEDALAAWSALRSVGVPADRIVIAGDSGGGGLANSFILRGGSPDLRPAGLILLSPEVDLRLADASIAENARTDILPWNIPTASYLHGLDPSAEGLAALSSDLSGLPPTLVSWGRDEIFRDPIRRYVDRLRDFGVETDTIECAGMFHVFQIVMPCSGSSHDVYKRIRGIRPQGIGSGRAHGCLRLDRSDGRAQDIELQSPSASRSAALDVTPSFGNTR